MSGKVRFTPDERFWPKVNKGGPIPTYAPHLGNCWIWTGAAQRGGYGRFRVNGRCTQAHSYAYGETPVGLVLDHLCRVPACVRPSHLEPVTRRENDLRGFGVGGINFRKTHCIQGHEFTEENTYHWRGTRTCLACHRARELRRRRAEHAPLAARTRQRPVASAGWRVTQ